MNENDENPTSEANQNTTLMSDEAMKSLKTDSLIKQRNQQLQNRKKTLKLTIIFFIFLSLAILCKV